MEAGESIRAVAAVEKLVSELWDRRYDGADFAGAGEAFKRLLSRRGYYVSTPQEQAAALDEVHDIGEGFDLYELARGLAEYDTTVTECLKLRPERLFPDLKRFSPMCSCGRHPEGTR